MNLSQEELELLGRVPRQPKPQVQTEASAPQVNLNQVGADPFQRGTWRDVQSEVSLQHEPLDPLTDLALSFAIPGLGMVKGAKVATALARRFGLQRALLGKVLPRAFGSALGGVVGEKAYEGAKGEFNLEDVPESLGLYAGVDLALQGLPPAFKYGKKVLAPANSFIDKMISQPLLKGSSYLMRDLKFIPTREKKWVHGKQESFQVKKSIADILEPAPERMPVNEAELYRDSNALKTNLIGVGESAAASLVKEGSVSTRHQVMKGIRGGEVKDPAAKKILSEMDSQIKDLTLEGKYENMFRGSIASGLNKSFLAPHEVFSGEKVIKEIETVLQGSGPFSSKVPKVQKSLAKIIEDPTFSNDAQALARDIYNLHSVLPEQVAKAAKKVTWSKLTSDLKKMPEMVLDQVPKGLEKDYLPSIVFKSKEGNSLFVKRDHELELRALIEIPKISHKMFNKWFLTPWKTWKVIDRPAAWVRNGFTNMMLNHMEGLPFWRQDIYKKALEDMMTGAPLFKELKKITGQGGTFTIEDVMRMNEGFKYGASLPEKLLAYHDKVQAPFRALYNAEEMLFKHAKFLHNLEKGMQKKEAAWDAVNATFNYGEVTRATARIKSNVAPFFTWTSKAVPRVAQNIMKHPVQWAGVITLYRELQNQAIQSAGMSDSEYKDFVKLLPDHIKDGMYFLLPWRDKDQRLQYFNLTYIIPGFGDLAEVYSNPLSSAVGNPLITLASGLYANQKFSGSKIYYDWDSPKTITYKVLAHLWEQIAPAMMLGGIDLNNLTEAYKSEVGEFGRSATAPTPTQALLSTVGAKVTPIKEEEAARRWVAKIKMQRSELRQDFLRAARKAHSQEEMDLLIKKYSENLRRILPAGEDEISDEE